MYKGEPTEGVEFYKLLYENGEFCRELGKAILAAGRLETELTRYLHSNQVKENTKKASLGQLIAMAEKYEIPKNLASVLKEIKEQRNYFAHKIFALFAGTVEETILPRSELLDSDVESYINYVWTLQSNLNGLADIVAENNRKLE